MARRNPPRWQTAIAVIVILAAVGLTVFLIRGLVQLWFLFWSYISHAQPTVGAAIIAASSTILISVLSVVVGRFVERNKELALRHQEIEREIREKHIPTYQELVEFLFKLFLSTKTGTKLTEKEVNSFFANFTQKILVWGSDRFIKDFSIFRETLAASAKQQQNGQAGTLDTNAWLTLEALLYSIRADCGHGNKGLGKGDLLALFINDIRDYIPKE